MAKIAVDLEKALTESAINGAPGQVTPRVVAQGKGWSVADVLCTSGPEDRRFEEQHSKIAIVVVAAGTFQYRASTGTSRASRELMTPGSVLLGNVGQSFECGHEHGKGDRCIAYWYEPDYFERLKADIGIHRGKFNFQALRIPPMRTLSPLVAQAFAGLTGSTEMGWEELGVKLATRALELTGGHSPNVRDEPPSTVARVTRAIRMIERDPNTPLNLESLAKEARLSPYHFLRTFERLTNVTPHQYVMRVRLREAALRLTVESSNIIDIALSSGFGDVSNFNRAFRTEFGVSPRAFRRRSNQTA